MKIYSYLLFIIIFSLISCKLWYSTENNAAENSDDIASGVANVKSMFESKVEIKASNKDNFKDMAEKVKIAASVSKDNVLNSKGGGKDTNKKIPLKDIPTLVSGIKNSSEKIDTVLKSLMASGYTASEPLKDNMKIGIDSICLLEKILKISNENGSIARNNNDEYGGLLEKVNKVIEEFKKEKGDSVAFSILNSSRKDIDVVKECIKDLMGKAEKFFGGNRGGDRNGVSELLKESANSVSEGQFNEPLKLLSEAAADIAEACKRLIYDIF
ncbi:hypothetical protein QIA30_06275 (plasmid) [Borreliella turdi]|uniref:hypothetical protein n=1 Tax=Borreliella turdi TaxID=57863 RepID=UPI003AF10456